MAHLWTGIRQPNDPHGVPVALLLTQGSNHREVASRVAGVLGAVGATVYSDAPEADGMRLGRVLMEAGIAVPVPVCDVRQLYKQACLPLRQRLSTGATMKVEPWIASSARDVIAAAEQAELAACVTRHRGLPDAERVWRSWRAVQQAVARHVAEGLGL